MNVMGRARTRQIKDLKGDSQGRYRCSKADIQGSFLIGVTLYLGGTREVLLRAFPGHTGGDTVVYDPESNVVFCGDLFWNRTLPNLIDASTKNGSRH